MYTREVLNIENCDEKYKNILKEYGKTGMLFIDTANNYKILVPIGIKDQIYLEDTNIHIFIYVHNGIWRYINHYNEKYFSYIEREKEKYLYKYYQKDILMIIKILYGL